MKNIIKFKLIIVAVLVLFASCEDFLDRPPLLSNSNELTLADIDGMNAAAAGCYMELYDTDWYGAAFPIIADLKADNAKSSPLSSGRYQIMYNWNQDAANTANFWDNAYYSITSACNLIEVLEAYELKPGEVQADLDQLKAEALFIRALAHFDLVRMYAQPYTANPSALGVPVITKTEIAEPARNTVQEVYTQIIADLETAVGLFAADIDEFYTEYRDGGVTTDHKAWASADAANALLARVYLYMADYAKAAEYATKVINSGNYSMYTAADYATVWGQDAQSEIIFEVWGSNGNSDNPYWEEIGYIYYGGGSYGDVCATNGLLSLYEAGDVRANLFSDYGITGYAWPLKYPGKAGDQRQNNIPVLRLSEMYLIRAEAVLNGASGDALADYNMIRTNRGLAAATAVTKNDIFDERRRELCFEGHLLFDYARLNKALDRVDEDNKISGYEDVAFPDHKWAMPIPIGELEANSNMVQNEGY